MTTMNEFPPRVLESLDSMDAFDNSSPNLQWLDEFLDDFEVNDFDGISWVDVDGAIDNFNLETDVDTLDNMLRNTLDDYTKNSEFEAVKLSNSTTLENRQHHNSVEPETEDTGGDVSLLQSSQTESVYINLEADECANYSTPSSSVSDIAADETFSHKLARYFPDFQEPFDEFVYPRGDPDAVCLSKRDVDLLKPDTYINDTIIDFYILYLKNKMQEQEKARFHFFNSFFFPKLAGMDKNAPYACDGKSAFQSVRKWTRKINLFEKDYIFIPVNFNCHWSLIVICHPGEVVNINDTEPEKSLRLPCILHIDSIKGYHSGLKDLVQSYLCEEWKERKKDTCGEDLSSRFLNMRFLPVEVPQQENSYDCGLFLLHHLELFLDEAPYNFNPLRITKFSNFLNSNWFPPAEAYLKRTFIRRLIFELVENHGSHEGFSPDNGDDCLCSEYNDNRIGGQCNLINGEASGRGIELAQPLNTSSMVLKENFEPGATLGTSLRHCKSFDQRSSNHSFNGSISTMEKDTDLSEHLQAEHLKAKSSLDTSSCVTDEWKIENFPVKEKSRSYPMSIENIRHLQDNSAATTNFPFKKESKSYWMSVEYIQQHLQIMSDSAAAINVPDMDDSDDIEIIENFPVQNKSRSSLEDGRREKYCTLTENLEHFPDMYDYAPISNLPDDPLIYFSQHSNMMCAGNRNWSPTLQLHQVSNAIDNEVFNDDVQTIDNVKLDWSPTLQLHQVSNAVDNEVFNDDVQIIDNMKLDWSPTLQLHQVSNAVDNEVFNDDVQINDNMKLDFWAERPAKKMRLMHFPGGSDGILTSFTCI